METITGLEKIAGQDPMNHLNCRKSQVLAYVSSKTADVNLAFSMALESTQSIWEHCYVERKYRWSYPTRYVEDDDLEALGFDLVKTPKIDFDVFPDVVENLVRRDVPGFFYAPRGYFPYWTEFMRNQGTLPDEYFEYHSFLVCGIDMPERQVLFLDIANERLTYQRYTVPLALIQAGVVAEPERWFVDCLELRLERARPDSARIESKYNGFLAQHRDDLALYGIMADSLEEERGLFKETYRAPFINGIALLAGSRYMFARFLASTTHSAFVKRSYNEIANLLITALSAATRYQTGDARVPASEIQRRLERIHAREKVAYGLLREEVAQTRIQLLH
jgi:hypothetical protein